MQHVHEHEGSITMHTLELGWQRWLVANSYTSKLYLCKHRSFRGFRGV